jgi:prevent-host-death family protein
MRSINIHEAKTHLSRLVDQASAGEEIIIARAGKPVARLMPLQSPTVNPRTLGLGKDRYSLPDNFDSIRAEELRSMFEESGKSQ